MCRLRRQSVKIRTALQEPGPLKRPNVLRKKNRIAHSLEERQAVTFFGRETGRHIFRKKDETKHSPEEGKDDKKNVSREEAAVRKKILTGLLCLAIPLLLAACSTSNAAESRETAEEKAETEEAKAETEEAKAETEEAKAKTEEVKAKTETEAEAANAAGSSSASAAEQPDLPEEEESDAEEQTQQAPVIYFTSDISPEGLVRIYEKLGWEPTGETAVKISTGEPPASNYLRPELIGDLVKKVDGTIVECNTAYGGSRSSSAMHKQVAEDHGFTAIADFDLMDEEGEVEWPMSGGSRLDKIIVGSHAENYQDWIILSHFKGHAMAGFGGAIKNVGIGISSPSGKVYVHTAGTKTSGSIWYDDQDAWLEALAEMVKGFSDHVGREHIVYINVMNRLSVDCDCDGNPAEPDIHDIGILAGYDPVALDQACVDLVYQAEGNDALVNRIEQLHGIHTLEHAEETGLGSRTYELVNIDE